MILRLKNATREPLFNCKIRDVEILKKIICLSKYGSYGNVNSREQWHIIGNCYQLIFRKSHQVW